MRPPRGFGMAAIALVLAAPAGRAPTPLPPTPPASAMQATATARIDGFRSAHFGTSEAAVRAAIAADFHLSGTSVRAGESAVQRTEVLGIHVANLMPGGGIAQIDYIFGYRSHTLMEVNILWSAATDPQTTPARLVATATALQAYFARQGFAPGKTVWNMLLPDGNVLVFRARDADGHAVVLVLSGKRVTAPAGISTTHRETLTPTALTLAYAADPARPDVFTLRKGSL